MIGFRRRFGGDRRGAVAVMAAVAGGVLCLITAAAVDLGALVLHTRRVQGAADLAALSAVQNLAQGEAIVREAASATVQANVAPDVSVTVATTLGVYAPDPEKARDQRFTPGGGTPNAARVEVTSRAPLFFSRLLLGRDEVRVHRRATAAAAAGAIPKAMISVGSRLARLDGGVANQVLSGLTGSKVSLSVMDYRALADLDVNLLGFTDALATDLGLQVGDYDKLLDTTVDAGRALKVLERLAGGDDGGALGRLASASVGTKVALGELIGVEAQAPQGVREGLDASVSAMDLVMAMLETGGDRQIALKLDVPAGLADLKTSLAIGERPNRSPWLTVTANGQPVIRTAQARLYVRARTAQSLSGLARVELPILVELAASEARLKSLSCGPARSVQVEVRPGVARAMIGAIDETKLDDFKTGLSPRPATLLSVLGLVSVTGQADVEAADAGFKPLTFDAADIEARRLKTVASRSFASGLVASLLQRLDVTVNVVGLGLGLGDLTKALGQLLTPLGPVLDGVLNPVLDVLGLKLGEADVTVHGLSCPTEGRSTPRLVG